MKKIVFSLSALALLGMAPFFAAHAQTPSGLRDGDRVQTTVVLNIRSGPSTSATILGRAPVGATGTLRCDPSNTNAMACPMEANGYTWWPIQWDNSSLPAGWSVEGDSEAVFLVKISSPSSSFQDGDRVRTSVALNVRSQPSTSGTVITRVRSGSTGTISCIGLQFVGATPCPTTANGYTWWYIAWDPIPCGPPGSMCPSVLPVSGWSAEGNSEAQFLTKLPKESQCEVPPPAGCYYIIDANGNCTGQISCDAGSQLTITTPSFPPATVNTPYTAAISAVGGSGSYFWSVSSGTLPPGLSLVNFMQCAQSSFQAPCQVPVSIVGTPTASGVFSFTVRVTSGNESASRAFTITVSTTAGVGTVSAKAAVDGTETPATLVINGGGDNNAVINLPITATDISAPGDYTETYISGTPLNAANAVFKNISNRIDPTSNGPRTLTQHLNPGGVITYYYNFASIQTSTGTPRTGPPPIITSLTPSSGLVGTTVTIAGSGFTSSNGINLDGSPVGAAVSSPNGTSLSFIIPALTNAGRTISPGSYNVVVTNANGASNPMSFTVTATSNSSVNLLQIRISRSYSEIGHLMYVNGTGFDELHPLANKVTFGSIILAPPISARTLTENFICLSNYGCYEDVVFAAGTQLFAVSIPENRFVPGTYNVTVANANGTSNTVPVTITQSMIPPRTNDQIGNIQIRRVASSASTALPAAMSTIDLDSSADPANPARYIGIPIGAYSVSVTDVAGYTERAGTCQYAIGTAECDVASFPTIPVCGINPSQPNAVALAGRTALTLPNPFLGSAICTVVAPVNRGFETKVVFQYTAGTIAPPASSGNMKIISAVIATLNQSRPCYNSGCGRVLYINGTGFPTTGNNIINFGNTTISQLSIDTVDDTNRQRFYQFQKGTQVISAFIPDAMFVPGTYNVSVSSASDTSNTAQVIIFPDS